MYTIVLADILKYRFGLHFRFKESKAPYLIS